MRRVVGLIVFLMSLSVAVFGMSGLPLQEEILANISEPVFRDCDYVLTCKPDGNSDCRQELNALIQRCSSEGGGRVILRKGEYFCKGPIVLKSNVNLHLEEGSQISFSPEPGDYLPAVLTVWEGTQLYNYSPLVYARGEHNIAITGKGVLNGRASEGFAKMRPQRSAQQDTLRQMGIDLVPVEQRCFGSRSILPPSMIQPYECERVLISGVTIIDGPYWMIHPVLCNNVIVRGVVINSGNKNNDGCDPEYTTNVLIEDCTFNTGDDSIAIKAGRDQDAWRIGKPSENILIRNCNFNSKCNGLCIGSEMSAGVQNVVMENVNIGRCYSGIYFKSNLDRGGFIRNVHVRNVTCEWVRSAFIRFETSYHGARGGYHPTEFSNFLIEDVVGGVSTECAFYAVGVEGHNLRDIKLRNVRMGEAPVPYILKYAEAVEFDNVFINEIKQDACPEATDASELKSY